MTAFETQNGFARNSAVMNPEEFAALTQIARQEAGLAIEPHKLPMVQTRLAPRLRILGLSSFNDYIEFVGGPEGTREKHELISALTTNVSSFFREKHHFQHLASSLGPDLLRKQKQGEPVRIWSAGCSNGQEAISIAMTLFKHDLVLPGSNLKILATDVDTKVLRFAENAIYTDRMLTGIEAEDRVRFFKPASPSGSTAWSPVKSVRNLIHYRHLNLLSDWPMKGKFDVVFCRNVAIYFDQPTQATLWCRLVDIVQPCGSIFLGHSERLPPEILPRLRPTGATIYQKTADENLK